MRDNSKSMLQFELWSLVFFGFIRIVNRIGIIKTLVLLNPKNVVKNEILYSHIYKIKVLKNFNTQRIRSTISNADSSGLYLCTNCSEFTFPNKVHYKKPS